MTNLKAIKILKKLYERTDITDDLGEMEDMTPYKEAVDMAIEALKKEPMLDKIRAEIAKRTIEQGFHTDEWSISYDELIKIIDKYKVKSEEV